MQNINNGTYKLTLNLWVHALPIGYAIVNLLSAKKNKLILSNKYSVLITLDIVAILISIVGVILSIFLINGF